MANSMNKKKKVKISGILTILYHCDWYCRGAWF